MKRKFILYPAVALALMTSVSLSSCVDTDEPDSITALRNAKAEEIRANAALLTAQSDVEKAYVAVVNAVAQQEAAAAKAAELENAIKEYEVATKAAEEALNQATKAKEKNELDAAAAAALETAKLNAEATKIGAEQALEAAKKAYQEAINSYKVALAKDEANTKADLAKITDGTSLGQIASYIAKVDTKKQELDTKYDELATAVQGKKETDYQEDVINATKALSLAKSYREKFEGLQAKGDVSDFVAEWKSLKDKVDELDILSKKEQLALQELKQTQDYSDWEAIEKKLKDLKAQIEPYNAETGDKSIKAAENAVKDAKADSTALVKKIKEKDNSIDIVQQFKDAPAGTLTFSCDNDALMTLINEDNPSGFENFVYDKKHKQFVSKSSAFKNSEIESKVQELINAFSTYGGTFDYNSNAYKAIQQKFSTELTNAEKAIKESEDGNLYNKYVEACKKLSEAANKDAYDEWKPKFEKYVKALFGVDATSEAKNKIKVSWFYSTTALCDLADKDQITDLILAQSITYHDADLDVDVVLDTKEKVWKELGLYGSWRTVKANQTAAAKKAAHDAAAKVIESINAKVKEYTDALAAKEEIKALGEVAYTDAEIAAMPEVVAAGNVIKQKQANLNTLKGQKDALQNQINEQQGKSSSCAYSTKKAELEKICDETEKGYIDDNVNTIEGFIKSLGSNLGVKEADLTDALKSVANFDAVFTQLIDLAKNKEAAAQNDLDKANNKLAAYKAAAEAVAAGDTTKYAELQLEDIKDAVSAVKTKEEELQKAIEDLNKEKAYYGIN
jgi:hypothetical protein